jgi:hypothetical protein
MIREQVLSSWNVLKQKFPAAQLSENEKKTWHYLAHDSKLANFSVSLVEYRIAQQNCD